jgi:oligopeptide transport system ATP-binding protein
MSVPAAPQPDTSANPAAAPVLSIKGLEIEFRTGRGTVRAVRGIDLVLGRRETLAVIGESGSGKSVTARAVLGILESPPGYVVGGAINFEGRDLLQMSHRERRTIQGSRIAMVFQDALAALNPLFPVGWQIAELFSIHRGLSMAEGHARAVELLRRIGIPSPEQRANQYPHQFSGGMRQRVVIAMAVALGPDILLADEPTTALDVTVQAQVMQLLAQLRDETGLSLMLITHNIAIAAEVADRVAVMYAGRVVEIGATRDMLKRPAHPYTAALVSLAVNTTSGAQAPIPGAPPDPAMLPSGCAFHPRCSLAREICRQVDPVLRQIRAGQQSACHFAEGVTL